jgi:solute carrier family 8 (sodium/calcium exchanger)
MGWTTLAAVAMVAALAMFHEANGAALVPKLDAKTNKTVMVCESASRIKCVDGIFLPAWIDKDPSAGKTAGKAIVYCLGLFFLFLGIAIISDRFMAAIEIITSQEKEIKVRDKSSGKVKLVTVKIWNETVSNLTLMALGSSAPEILLSVIEICGRGFEAGELGPSTIVGSAAFNLFMITAVCVSVLPPGETRKIASLNVFAFTATNSICCYIWMYLILSAISPGQIDVWEGIVTLLGMPFLVGVAYLIDIKVNFYRLLRGKMRKQKKGGQVIHQTGDGDIVAVRVKGDAPDGDIEGDEDLELLAYREGDDPEAHMNEKKRIAMEAYHKAREANPDADAATLQRIVESENMKMQHKSRAFYRIQANKAMTGQGNIYKKKHDDLEEDKKEEAVEEVADKGGHMVPPSEGSAVYFHPAELAVVESCGNVYLNVLRCGADMFDTIYVDYATSDGTANGGDAQSSKGDFVHTEGTLTFKPGETSKTIVVPVIDDDIFELDEYFFCKLTGVRSEPKAQAKAVLGTPDTATVTILDDDYPGVFTLEHERYEIMETVGFMTLRIVRLIGARGIIRVPYYTAEGTAKGGGEDFEDCVGEIEFKDEETVKTIDIQIIDKEEYDKNKCFNVFLGEPRVIHCEAAHISNLDSVEDEELRRILEAGKPALGEHKQCEVVVTECKEFRKTIDAMVGKANLASFIKSSSWAEQFREAFTVEAGDEGDDEAEDGEEPEPSYFDYFMHYLSLFWKVLFALVPPTDIWNGWGCFYASLAFIGILTAVTGDVASHFGCTIGLADSVTAISFVALGTSLPDTFASKVATEQDETADSSVGNVTGSNSVNVYLGIGIAWSLAAVFHESKGNKFIVIPGSLGFSVLVFCCFAIATIAIMMFRRFNPNIGAELGGHPGWRKITSTVLVLFWLFYVVLSALETYCMIDPGF